MPHLYSDPNTLIEVRSVSAKSLTNEIAKVDSAYDFQQIFGYLPNPDPILKAEGADIDLYRTLLGDAHVGAVVDSVKDALKALEWTVDRGKAKNKHARFVQDWLGDFDLATYLESVVDARLYGYQPLEAMWRDMNGLTIPYDLIAKPQRWFVYGQKGDLRFRTVEAQMEGVPLDKYPRKFLVPRYAATYTNPYGTGVLSRCFWPLTGKKAGWKFFATYLEKFSIPHVVIKVPPSTTDDVRRKLMAAGEAMVHDAVAVINDTDRLELHEANDKGGASDMFDRWLIFNNEEISKAIKSETLTTQIGRTGGAYAASQTHSDVAATGIDSVKNLAVRYINIVVEWMMQVNVSESITPPKIAPYEEEDVDKDMAERDKSLVDPMTASGLRFSKVYYMKNYGFEDEDIEDAPQPTAPTPNPAMGAPLDVPPTDPVPPTPPANFAAPTDSPAADATVADALSEGFPGQDEIDRLFESFSAADLQAVIEPVLQPVIDLVRNAASYADIEKKLYSMYSKMPAGDFEEQVAKIIFLGEMWGRTNAEAAGAA